MQLGLATYCGKTNDWPIMTVQFVKNFFFKLSGRRVLIPAPVNSVIGIHPVDGIFCLIADRRIYDDVGLVVEGVYDAETNGIVRSLRDGGKVPDKRVMRLNLGLRGCIHVFEKADGSQYSIRIGSDAK